MLLIPNPALRYVMIYVDLPDNQPYKLPFYLAMEEYLAARVEPDEELFFMWQVGPTVIFGRNQIAEREVNLAYCRENGIEYYRRRSGGGCVFANRDNIMMSYITGRRADVASTFSHYTSKVAAMLRQLGLNAEASDRNDILIDGLKVSGNAFYHTPCASIVHGTMLFGADTATMAAAITPSAEKLRAKGVDSVRSRITSLDLYLDMPIEEFRRFAREYMTESYITLTDSDIEEIHRLEQPYYDHDWIFRLSESRPRHSKRIEAVGEMAVELKLTADGRIADLLISGDFFELDDLRREICTPLRGVEFSPRAVEEALAEVSVGNVISGMDKSQLINLLFN